MTGKGRRDRSYLIPMVSEPMTHSRMSEERVTLGALFTEFLKVSLYGLGGGLLWAHRSAVEQRRWISEEEFADILSLCQFMPGPNVVGIAVCVGANRRGSAGAIAAAAGFVVIPWTIGFSLGVLLLQYAHIAVLQNILGGISAAAAGLLIATGIRILRPHRKRPMALALAALAFGGIVFTKLPLLVVLFTLASFGIAVSWIASWRPR
jgi:chromate transporter